MTAESVDVDRVEIPHTPDIITQEQQRVSVQLALCRPTFCYRFCPGINGCEEFKIIWQDHCSTVYM